MSDIGKRFPFDAYPKGWFQVAYSRDVDAGQVVGLHYFGRRLICYRGASGTPYVLDAYCPHLGADIAVGGTIASCARFTAGASTALDRTSKSRTRRP
jgi:Rieske [2Fe-2S] domain